MRPYCMHSQKAIAIAMMPYVAPSTTARALAEEPRLRLRMWKPEQKLESRYLPMECMGYRDEGKVKVEVKVSPWSAWGIGVHGVHGVQG